MLPRFLQAVVVLSLLAVLSSCEKKQQPQTFVPPPPKPAATVVREPPTPPEPPSLPGSELPLPAPIPGTPISNLPYRGKKPKPKTRRPAPVPAAAPAPVPEPAATAPVVLPHLVPLLSPDEQREFDAAISRSLAHVDKNVADLPPVKNLTMQQQGMLSRIANFAGQARELRKTDMQAAKSLAERAALLVDELASSLRVVH